ncbi:MAG: glycosyltransferase family 9 protein [Ignavibacterium sp.]|nr:glycosyltransferase family 9 protein [Ignavibacterium sp.]MDW8374610.1 glycosyltransferase family 9 protein [Ignavibacteriales bacterium]
MKIDFKKIKNILVIRLSSLGDILLTTPLLRAIKTQYPNVKIDFLAKQEYSDLMINNPNIENLFLLNKDGIINPAKKNSSTTLGQYDLIIDLQNNIRSRRISSKLRTQIVRFKKYSIRKLLLVRTKINLMKDFPSIPERYAETIDIKLDDKGVEIISYKETSKEIKNLKKIIGICPGSKHFTKRYPIEYQINLCKLLVENNFNVVLFGGKLDKEICQEISERVQHIINLQNDDDILQTVADMKMCDVIVCNDSGLMHVASSFNKKLIAIFGSTVKEFGFTPYNCPNAIIVENENLNCRPCSHIGRDSCPKFHFRCMKDLKPEIIFNLIRQTNG